MKTKIIIELNEVAIHKDVKETYVFWKNLCNLELVRALLNLNFGMVSNFPCSFNGETAIKKCEIDYQGGRCFYQDYQYDFMDMYGTNIL